VAGACICLLLALGGTWDLGLRLEVRRPSPTIPMPDSPEVEADPTIDVRSAPGDYEASGGYDPRIVMGGIAGSTVTALHRFHADESMLLSPRVRLQMEEHAEFGSSIISLLGPAATPTSPTTPVQPATPELLPAAQIIHSVNLSAGLSLASALSARFTNTLGAAFFLSGGFGAASRAILPLQHGPLVHEQLDYALSRIDSLSATMDGSESIVSGDQRAGLLGIMAGYHRRFTQDVRAELAAGISLADATLPGARTPPDAGPGSEQATVPLGAAALYIDLPDRTLPMTFSLHATNTNAISPLTIGIYQRAQGDAALDVRPLPELLLSASGLVARAYGSLAGSMAQTELRAAVQPARFLQFVVGARAAWLSTALAPAGLAGFQWTAYFAVAAVETGTF